ncbi:MAG: hypothetical protein K6G31_02250 [Paludibacteraceae bacterium]|nr:hypothetical protein [Paludibacteraceae bacterium]
MLKKIVLFLLASLSVSASASSDEKETLLDLQLGNGWHAFGYDAVADVVDAGSVELGTAEKFWGCNLGATLNRYFKYGFGFQTGLRLYLYRTDCVLDSTERYTSFDLANGSDCLRTVRYDNWEEFQTNLLLAVPIGAAFKKDIAEKCDVYAGAGVELLLPLVSNYKVEDGKVDVSGYYGEYDVEFSDMPVHNFTVYDDRDDGKFGLKVGLSVYLDAGVRYHLSGCDLNAGLYLSYGLTNMADGDESHLFDLDNDYAGLLNSDIVKKANPIAFGIKVGVTLPLKKKEK